MIKFDKMHGNGNDFVVMDSIRDDFVPKKIFIRKLADRNTGVGFDQLILIDLPTKPDLDFFVKFYNADGSQANMCLNGVRCAASYIWSHSLAPKKSLKFQTKKIELLCEPFKNQVKVTVPCPKIYQNVNLSKSISKKLNELPFDLVDVGNIHLCIKKNSISKDDLSALYKKLEKNIKPFGINLSIYKNVKGIAEIRTYENGVGETLSCGSASLSVSSLLLKGKINKLRIRSFGGELNFVKSNESILMTGPTAFVYSGDINE